MAGEEESHPNIETAQPNSETGEELIEEYANIPDPMDEIDEKYETELDPKIPIKGRRQQIAIPTSKANMWGHQMDGIRMCEENYARFMSDIWVHPQTYLAAVATLESLWNRIRHGMYGRNMLVMLDGQIAELNDYCFDLGVRIRKESMSNNEFLPDEQYKAQVMKLRLTWRACYWVMAKTVMLIPMGRKKKYQKLIERFVNDPSKAIFGNR